MNLTHNQVLIYPFADYTKVGDFELYDEFEPGKRINVQGAVISVPNRLVYLRKEANELANLYGKHGPIKTMIQDMTAWSTEFETEMELRIGDIAVFRYIAKIAAMEDEQFLDVGLDRPLILVDYDQIYMAIRNGRQVMLNGWMMVEPIEYSKEDLIKMGNGMEVYVDDMAKPGMGIVRQLGSPVKGYLDDDRAYETDVQVGDTIMFRHSNMVSIEYKTHKELNEGALPYYRLQRRDVLAILK